jgi:serine/threonine-protein kinase
VGHDQDLHYIVQEYVPGVNLRQYMDRTPQVDVGFAGLVLTQVAAALTKAEQHGIVHRDIKPENILIAADGRVKVVDFGLARASRSDDQPQLTEVGMTMGTPLYMSPEQIEGKSLDTRSDIYSLGVTAYQLLTGRPPFSGDTPLSIALQHLNSQPAPLSNGTTALPDRLNHVILQMLAKAPSDRMTTAAELQSKLEQTFTAIGTILPRSDTIQSLHRVIAQTAASPIVEPLDETRSLAVQLRHQGVQSTRRAMTWLAVGIGVMCGGILGWTQWPTDPLTLDTAETLSTVEDHGSPEAQFVYAAMVRTEAGWQSVLKYYPASADDQRQRYYAHRAQQQLARLYVDAGNHAAALRIAQELGDLSETEQEFRLFGLAVQAILYDQRGQRELAAQRLAAVWPARQQLDPDTLDRIERLQGGAQAGAAVSGTPALQDRQ